MAADHSTSHIYQSFFANCLIAVAKGAAAVVSGSGAMLAEAIHSAADSGNQLLLLLGVWRSRKPATPRHPLGYGRGLYFWSFMVALLLFTGGGVFSVYEGWHKLHHPEPVTNIGLAVAVLVFALVIEGYATYSNIKLIQKRRLEQPFFKYLRTTKDSDLVVVFGENAAATLGLLIALPALILSWWTGSTHWDALGTLAIGVVLILVAIFLAVEVKSLLIGECADPKIENSVREVLGRHPEVSGLLRLLTVQQGPGQVLLMMKLGFQSHLNVAQVCSTINALENDLRQRCPEIRWLFVEPDQPRQN